uniref:Capsid and scaffold protein n=2 Tax=Strongyloides papillosus TaxID=174720 RepID=A0A0N5B5Y2_STREA
MSDISTIMVDTPSNDVVTEAIGTNSQNNETEVPSSTKVESKKN